MQLFAGALLQGLVSGSIIALLAAGITLVHRTSRVLNLAQGSLATLAAYLFFQLHVSWGITSLFALPFVLTATAVFSTAMERFALRPLAGADATTRSAGTIGLVLIIQWLVLTVWGAEQRFLPSLGTGGVSILGVRLGFQHVTIVLVTIAVGAALAYLSTQTRVGLASTAVAQDATAARLLGVSASRVTSFTFAAAGVLAGLAGILATPLLVLTPSQMTLVMVVALGASLAGGFESLPRTVGAGLGLGVLQSFVTAYAPASTGLPQIAGFLAVIAILAVVRRRIDLVDVLRGTA